MPADDTGLGAALPPTARGFGFSRVGRDGAHSEVRRDIAEETPIAFEYQGLGYAVLMASPADLEDLAYGFSLSERLVGAAAEIRDVDVWPTDQGVIVRITLDRDIAHRIGDRVRRRAADSSCGLCGVENLEQALRPLPRLEATSRAGDAACFQALAALEGLQPLNGRTRAVHAAAACTRDGEVVLVREDVGRHNAFDKLIGALMRRGQGWDGGFALVTSRCSYELVEKAVLAGCPMLATISAPTALALDRAATSGLALKTLVRPDAFLSRDGGV